MDYKNYKLAEIYTNGLHSLAIKSLVVFNEYFKLYTQVLVLQLADVLRIS